MGCPESGVGIDDLRKVYWDCEKADDSSGWRPLIRSDRVKKRTSLTSSSVITVSKFDPDFLEVRKWLKFCSPWSLPIWYQKKSDISSASAWAISKSNALHLLCIVIELIWYKFGVILSIQNRKQILKFGCPRFQFSNVQKRSGLCCFSLFWCTAYTSLEKEELNSLPRGRAVWNFQPKKGRYVL